jgi:hypothetical protein
LPHIVDGDVLTIDPAKAVAGKAEKRPEVFNLGEPLRP